MSKPSASQNVAPPEQRAVLWKKGAIVEAELDGWWRCLTLEQKTEVFEECHSWSFADGGDLTPTTCLVGERTSYSARDWAADLIAQQPTLSLMLERAKKELRASGASMAEWSRILDDFLAGERRWGGPHD